MTNLGRLVLLLTFSLALALWARRRTKLEVPEPWYFGPSDDPSPRDDAFLEDWEEVQPHDPRVLHLYGQATNIVGFSIGTTATFRPEDQWSWTA